MKITPLDIYNKEFTRKFSIMAYDEKEVDEFLDHVAAAYERLFKELNQAKEESERLKGELSKYQQMERTLQETMIVAQETAKERRDQAEREAQLVVENAINRSKQIVADAKEQVKERLQQVNQLHDYEKFFRARFKSLLETYMQMMTESEIGFPEPFQELAKEVATSSEAPIEEEVNNWMEETEAKRLLLDRELDED